jgi:pantoate--beta-alanine ligase
MAALVLSRSLEKARELVKQGERRSKVVYQAMREIIRKEKLARLEYLALVDSENLNPVKTIQRGTLIALAVKIGSTRLIDNWLVKKLPPPKPTSRLPH